jgi:RNA polymerase sigma-70 factor (family 1)
MSGSRSGEQLFQLLLFPDKKEKKAPDFCFSGIPAKSLPLNSLAYIVNAYRQYETHALLQLIRKDDEQAFTELYNRYWQKLFGVAYNRLKEIQSAEDVVHDVFASFWAGRRQIEISKADQYFATAVKYAVFSRLKKKDRERDYQRSLAASPPSKEFPAETTLHYKRMLEIIRTEVEKLPERCRLVFQYSRNEGMAVKEIAEELNISPKTVENQLTKALKHLKVAIRSFFSFLLIFFLPG